MTRRDAARPQTSSPSVSVLMPVGPAEQPHLVQAFNSIAVQSLRSIQIVVVLDRVSPTTAAVVESLADGRLTVVEAAGGGSLGHVLNQGLSHCRGEFIARMDSDDISHPRRLETQARRLEQDRRIAVLGTSCRLIDSSGLRIGAIGHAQSDWAIRLELALRSPFIHPSVMMRKRMVEAAGGYPEHSRKVEDYLLWLQLARFGALENLGQRLLAYRIHGSQVSRTPLDEIDVSLIADGISFYCRSTRAAMLAPLPGVLWRLRKGRQGADCATPNAEELAIQESLATPTAGQS